MSKTYDFEDYIRTEAPAVRARMKKLRAIFRKVAPKATEKLAWSMPTFYQEGNLLHFCPFREHISVFPGTDAVAAFAPKVSGRATSKGTIQFPHDEPLPEALITRIAKFCLKRNLDLAKAKAVAKAKAKAAKKNTKKKTAAKKRK